MKTLSKVLVPLDGSELSARMLVPVKRLAQRTSAKVRAVQVLDGFEADQAQLRGENPHALAAASLRRQLEPLEAAGIEVGFDTYLGDPASVILDDAVLSGASLIALATHGRSGVERWVRGSVAERVLRHAPVPVFIANPRAIGAELPIARILVPLDGSELAAAALPLAADFARAHGAELVLVTVAERGEPAARDARGALDAQAKRVEGVKVRVAFAEGTPAFGILEAAEAEQVGLIAMSTHGRSGPSRWAFGSTAEDVVRHATVPLLVVRAGG